MCGITKDKNTRPSHCDRHDDKNAKYTFLNTQRTTFLQNQELFYSCIKFHFSLTPVCQAPIVKHQHGLNHVTVKQLVMMMSHWNVNELKICQTTRRLWLSSSSSSSSSTAALPLKMDGVFSLRCRLYLPSVTFCFYYRLRRRNGDGADERLVQSQDIWQVLNMWSHTARPSAMTWGNDRNSGMGFDLKQWRP